MANVTTIESLQQTKSQLPATRAGFFDAQSFELMQRVGKAFAASPLVPQAYQGNLASCMIALDMADRIGASPLSVMQSLYIVHGTPSWSSKFLIATVNTCGRFSSLRYEWRGEEGKPDYGCRAWAIEKATGERLDGIWVDWRMVNAEGWNSKNGSKWKTMPDQMFIYRAAAFWQRAYAPEISMGMNTAEEAEDVFDARPDGSGSYAVNLDDLKPKAPDTSEATEQKSATIYMANGEVLLSCGDPEPAAEPEPKPEAEKRERKPRPQMNLD